MNAALLIARKRDGHALAAEEIGWLIDRYARGHLPDYQMAALAMAIYFQGMNGDETVALARAMLNSGRVLRWPQDTPPKIDKHSTGGVGDKVSLVLAPLLACCGAWVPMLSGRGLGATGGTLDKLESIPGFRTDLSLEEIRRLTERIGCVITGSTAELVPADRKLYALRDVTATVPSIPLIASSIMSKKLAEGLDALVLDVKFGSGAFIKEYERAVELARTMTEIAAPMGVRTTALLTDMNQPLGRMAGNAVEVNEALDVLAGGGPADLVEVTLALGAEALALAGIEPDRALGAQQLQSLLDSGAARERFSAMVAAQGGELDAPRPIAPAKEVFARESGYVAAIDTEALGIAVVELGGGRKKMSDRIDPSVGVEMLVRLGEAVEAGQPLVRIFAPPSAAERVAPQLQQAIPIRETAPVLGPPVAARIDGSGANPV